MPLYLTVTAMVVGEHEPFRRDHLTGASSTELNHRVFQRTATRVVDVPIIQLQPQRFHLLEFLLLDRWGIHIPSSAEIIQTKEKLSSNVMHNLFIFLSFSL